MGADIGCFKLSVLEGATLKSKCPAPGSALAESSLPPHTCGIPCTNQLPEINWSCLYGRIRLETVLSALGSRCVREKPERLEHYRKVIHHNVDVQLCNEADILIKLNTNLVLEVYSHGIYLYASFLQSFIATVA